MFINANLFSIEQASNRYISHCGLTMYQSMWKPIPKNEEFGLNFNRESQSLEFVYLERKTYYDIDEEDVYFWRKRYEKRIQQAIAFHVGLVLPKQKRKDIKPIVDKLYGKLTRDLVREYRPPGEYMCDFYAVYSIPFSLIFELASCYNPHLITKMAFN